MTLQEFWDVWQDWAATLPYGTRLTEDMVRTKITDAFVEAPTFYDEWVKGTRVGTPLLAVKSFSTSGSSGPRSVTLGQVQNTMFPGWSVFTNVPYHLACAPVANSGNIAFSQCTSTTMGTPVAPPLTVGSSTSWSLSPDAGAGSAPMPAYLGVVSGWRLRPDGTLRTIALTMSGATSTPWPQLLCDQLGATVPCKLTTDTDHDGWPAAGDCDDASSSVFPFRSGVEAPTTGDSIDYNCDTWAYSLGMFGGS